MPFRFSAKEWANYNECEAAAEAAGRQFSKRGANYYICCILLFAKMTWNNRPKHLSEKSIEESTFSVYVSFLSLFSLVCQQKL